MSIIFAILMFSVLIFVHELGHFATAKLGGTACPVMNGANEAAVALYLEDKIGFYDIYELVKGAMDAIPFIQDPTLEQVLECDAAARRYVAEHAAK